MNLQYVSPWQVELKPNPINFVLDTFSLHPYTSPHPTPIPQRTLARAPLLGIQSSNSRQTLRPLESASLRSPEVGNDTPTSIVSDSTAKVQTSSIATVSPPSSTSSPALSLSQASHVEGNSTEVSTPTSNDLVARENSAPQNLLGSQSSHRCPRCGQQFLKRHLLK